MSVNGSASVAPIRVAPMVLRAAIFSLSAAAMAMTGVRNYVDDAAYYASIIKMTPLSIVFPLAALVCLALPFIPKAVRYVWLADIACALLGIVSVVLLTFGVANSSTGYPAGVLTGVGIGFYVFALACLIAIAKAFWRA